MGQNKGERGKARGEESGKEQGARNMEQGERGLIISCGRGCALLLA